MSGRPGETDDPAAEADRLRAENERLRAAFARAKNDEYRRSAYGLAAVGALSALAAVLFPSVRDVLFALAATGGFAAVLTYYLTPERVVPASVGERVYAAWATNADTMVAELGLSGAHRYVPDSRGVRLFVPRDERVAADALGEGLFQATDETPEGVALYPAGEALFEEFETTLTGGLAAQPETLGEQLAAGVAETFELADSAETEAEPGEATLAVDGSVYGDATRFDHPVGSLFAVGLARGLDEPVELETVATPDGRAEYVIRATWDDTDAA